MATQRPVLGKGLASLFPTAAMGPPLSHPQAAQTAASAAPQQDFGNRDRHPGISFASVDDIIPNQYQPRREFNDASIEELAQSIRSNGIIQPLIVRKGLKGYELIAGERRLRASKIAGLKHVPIVIKKSTDREALEMAIIENVQRQDLNCIDEALAYFQLINDFNLTQEETALRVGKERSTVANHLRLLRLPEAIIKDLKNQVLSFGHGKVLLSVEDHELRLKARTQIIEGKLSVRETEALIEELKAGASVVAESKAAPVVKTPIQSRLAAMSLDLSRQYSSKVEIKGTERKGKIMFQYSSREELERILSVMQNVR